VDSLAAYKHKIINTDKELKSTLARWRLKEEHIVFTNGCFDVLHLGHFHTLCSAKKMGTKLIVGLNSDNSIKRLKGKNRPIFNEQNRVLQLSVLSCIDAIKLFKKDTPLTLIEKIRPNSLVKGGDYKADEIVGASFLKSYGGKVKTIPFLEGFSTSSIINVEDNRK